MRIAIGKKQWTVRHVTDVPPCDKDVDLEGLCVYTDRTIYVRKDIKGRMRMEVEIHELMHAIDQNLQHNRLAGISWELARALWKMGYRKKGSAGSKEKK